jgi:adenylate kinase family enzyme
LAEGPIGRRVAIYGPSGSGKTTLGRQLGAALGLPYIELDAIMHAKPNWVDLSESDFRAAVAAVLETNTAGWVVDGNYAAARDLVLGRADTVVWLHLPFRTVYPRLVKRTLVRSAKGSELWNGNRESWRQTLFTRDSMLWWGIKTRTRTHKRIREALASIPHHARVFELRSPREVDALVARAKAQGAFSPIEPIQRA